MRGGGVAGVEWTAAWYESLYCSSSVCIGFCVCSKEFDLAIQ